MSNLHKAISTLLRLPAKWRVAIKRRIHDSFFITNRLSIFANPFYLARNGLYLKVLENSDAVFGRVLDVGCGSKPYEDLFARAESYCGVDVEVSGHNHEDSKIDIYYDGFKLPFVSNSFDAVVSFEVLEHVADERAILGEIFRVLKPGGVFMLSVPFFWNEHEEPYDFRRLTVYGLNNLLENSQFEVAKIEKTTTHFLALYQMSIGYFYRFMLWKAPFVSRLSILIFGPLNIAGLILDSILPKSYDLYLGSVAVARKPAR